MVSYFCKNCNIKVEKSECSICGKRAELKSELFWCETCNIPTYTEECPICHGHGKYFTSDARPVFPEERLLVETLLGKPLAFINDSVWNGSGNRYYVNGKKVPLSISKIDELNPEEIRNTIKKYESQNIYSTFDSMIEKWVTANSTHFDFITTEAKQYIAGFSKKYVNDETNAAFVSFSGGKDSTVVSDLVRKALGNPSIIHIFGNTTLEFPQTYEYIERFKKTNRKTPLLRAENKEQDFFNLCETFGPPSRALRWCCTIFKTGFIGDKIRKTFPDRKSILTFYGIRRSESTSRNNYERSSEGKKISKQLVASPIIDWLDYDIWLYLLTTKIDFNSAYRLGYTRVGCWCCPNNSKWSQFLASIYMPEMYQKFHNILYRFAVKMGKEDPEDYVNSGGWKARQGGAGIELSKNVAIDFKPCATDSKSFNYVLSKPITKDMLAIKKGYDNRHEVITQALLRDFLEPKSYVDHDGKLEENNIKTLNVQAAVLNNYFSALKYHADKTGKWSTISQNIFYKAAGFIGAITFFMEYVLPKCVSAKSFKQEVISQMFDFASVDMITPKDIETTDGRTARKRVIDNLKSAFISDAPGEMDYDI